MKKQLLIPITAILIFAQNWLFAQERIVDKYGKLFVKGNYIMSQYGDTVQLRGMSLFWSQWMPQYYNADAIKWLRDDWKCTVVRAAMGVEMGGYATSPNTEKENVFRVVDAAIEHGIYVIIDYHSHEAHKNPLKAKVFFEEMAEKYGKYPNVLYEIYNEPLQETDWELQIKPYSEKVIKVIRQYASDNIIICGTRQWCQQVSEAASNPIIEKNIAYSLHYYAASHKSGLRIDAKKAIEKGACLFVSEFGTCEYTGNGVLDSTSTREWWDFLDKHKISWTNWSIADKDETASALKPNPMPKGGWSETYLTESGKFVRNELILKNAPILAQKKKTQPTVKKKK